MKSKLQQFIKTFRNRIAVEKDEYIGLQENSYLEWIDKIINDKNKSDLEKAFFVCLNQYLSTPQNYFVVTNERVRANNIYDFSKPHYDYEIDFAVYSGTIEKPIKIAIECDGLRSHSYRKTEKDRRKDVNLQASGWIVVRFNSREIHEELEKCANEDLHTNRFHDIIENIIDSYSNIITHRNYVVTEVRSKLTGMPWGTVNCISCGFSQDDIVDISVKCRKCGNKIKPQNP